MRIDAHQHFWLLAARQGEWPQPELAPIYRDFLPPDMLPLLRENGVDGTILVQTLSSAADTDFMLDLAAQHRFIRGVVGWADLKTADAPRRVRTLAAHPELKGLRPMVQAEAADWLDDPAIDPAAEAMAESGLCFDALVLPRHLPSLLRFARRHPALAIVIDHAAKPEIAAGGTPGWAEDMAALAGLPNMHCKLSGLLTEAGIRTGIDDIRPYTERLVGLFGTGRLIWGSDWPVLRLAGDYAGWLEMCRQLVPADAHDAVFGGNAAAFYRLD
ncbi:amidohydrolase family protein [Azospirillum sp. YIM B02556]|uniref:Amidohydrolase family protein n=1 Tax=Azospirillum endophyticum TaxID=2800326 RepID=A0ABS1FGE0_9PROT|nr:amidohydrolase family protein [Azospirillum endophyticum]MBK1842267.1 amidohydrolase family protein [Azospirillum endophyticum]